MPQAAHDSGLALLHGSWSDGVPAGDLPVLDLSSTDPLPFDLNEIAREPTAAPAMPAPAAATMPAPWSAAAPAPPAPAGEGDEFFESPDGSIWLRGEVLMCACPDCTAPMSIRLWLMLADCWRCGTTIELNEEQEREVERLIERRDRAREQRARRRAATEPK
jgi:hypothetical protein